MKPVMQSIFPNDAQPLKGDCFRACVASILELPLVEVPHFLELKDWAQAFDDWLAKWRLAQFEVRLDVEADQAYLCPVTGGIWAIATGHTNRHPTRLHAVVARTRPGGFIWDYIHDPHPAGSFLTKCTSFMFFVHRDPAIQLRSRP